MALHAFLWERCNSKVCVCAVWLNGTAVSDIIRPLKWASTLCTNLRRCLCLNAIIWAIFHSGFLKNERKRKKRTNVLLKKCFFSNNASSHSEFFFKKKSFCVYEMRVSEATVRATLIHERKNYARNACLLLYEKRFAWYRRERRQR